jgi:hypothetical protein
MTETDGFAMLDQQPDRKAQPGSPAKELIFPGESFLVAGRPAFILNNFWEGFFRLVVERLLGKDLAERVRIRPLTFERSGWFLVRAIANVPETFRFASTAPFHVEVGATRSTVHRDDVAFFLRWIDERVAALERDRSGLADPARKEAVLGPHREARRFFERLLGEAR